MNSDYSEQPIMYNNKSSILLSQIFFCLVSKISVDVTWIAI